MARSTLQNFPLRTGTGNLVSSFRLYHSYKTVMLSQYECHSSLSHSGSASDVAYLDVEFVVDFSLGNFFHQSTGDNFSSA